MRTLVILLAALVMAFSPPAVPAKPDKAPPGRTAKAERADPPGKADKPAKAESPPQNKKSKKGEPPGQAKGKARGPAGDGPPGQDKSGPPGGSSNGSAASGNGVVPVQAGGAAKGGDQNEARRALETREALPLAKIVAIAQSGSPGHVINARLVRIEGTLLYQVTLLDPQGQSWREYYDARTGARVIR